MPPADNLAEKPERVRVAHIMDSLDRADEQTIRQVRAIHYGMINFIDDCVGRVTQTLEKLRLADNTLIVFTSDHGDSMGAHGVIQKHNFFYDSFTQVPFIVVWPGSKKTGRCEELVELVDIMPTLLDAAGCKHPYGLQGKSLAPYFKGGDYVPRPFAVIESGEQGEPMTLAEITARPQDPYDESCFVWCAWREAWLGRGRCIRTKDWKLSVYANGESELYDMKNDPDELHNLTDRPEYDKIARQLRDQLLLWTIGTLDPIPRNTTVGLNYRSKFAAN
jgi:arylsulfatase A-like enzyme